ncbi:hemolysin family protein [Terrabacter lapilli]|uniref:Hemolysin family protein n=1 Tax=Terrabacter lapilli TaxID=436231 RepID=A0ABN2RB98_9MICO
MSTALGIILGVTLILALTAATGYFVAQEFAYVAVDRNALRQLADQGDAAAQRALRVTSQLSFTLSAAQFGITVTALLVGYVSEPLVGVGLAGLLDPSMPYAARLSLSVTAVLVFSTVLQMVFGELAPKNYAIARTVPLARALSRSTLLYLAVAGPVVRLFDRASTALLRKVGIEPVEELEQGATAEDLTRIIDESHAGGLLDDDLSEVLEGGLRFRELDAGDVMTPRVRVTTIRSDAPVSQLLELLDTGWSRFPVTGRDGDDIVGVAGIAELLSVAPELRSGTTVGSVASEATVVPTSAPLPRVLEQIRTDHRQLAVVVDEHGGFAGIVTFEDIAEEVVGEILDEDDVAAPGVVEAGPDCWVVPGHLRLDELDTATELRLTSSDSHTTISGLMLELLGRTAVVGDEARLEARRDLVPDGRTDGAGDGRQQAAGSGPATLGRGDDEPEGRHRTVSVQLTVESVARHVPSTVRVQVLHALPDPDALAEALPEAEPPGAAEEAAAAGRSVDERAEARR